MNTCLRNIYNILFIFVLVHSVVAKPLSMGFILGKSYQKGREMLIKQGYKPLSQVGIEGTCPGISGIEIAACRVFPETASCAVDAHSPCRFEWASPYARRFGVVTTGSSLPSLVIRGYDFEPPGYRP